MKTRDPISTHLDTFSCLILVNLGGDTVEMIFRIRMPDHKKFIDRNSTLSCFLSISYLVLTLFLQSKAKRFHGSRLGSQYFQAGEQRRKERNILEADIWSYGLLLWYKKNLSCLTSLLSPLYCFAALKETVKLMSRLPI